MREHLFILLILSAIVCSCGYQNPYALSTFSDSDALQVVIEIPAGTNKKIEIQPETGRFVVDQRDGKDRVIDYLPYPANYGFIPGTLADTSSGGDGDALDVFVLSESLPTATVIQVIPLAMVRMLDDGQQDDKILAVPLDESLRIIKATTYDELQSDYPGLLNGLENWLLGYDPTDPKLIQGWVDEQVVRTTIEASIKK